MVQHEEIRTAFSKRLKAALAAHGVESWGAGARLAKVAGVTPKAASKWLNGEAIPGPSKLLAIANELGVRREWLQYEEGAMSAAQPDHGSNVESGPPIVSPFREIRIVGTAQMGSEGYWYAMDEADGFVDVPSRDPGAYALRLRGDSMAPAIRSGWIAVCEPNHSWVPGEYVMIRLVEGECMVKELLYANDTEVSVMSVNDAFGRRTIPVEQIEAIHYVGAILPPSKVRL
ncbi:S24 family peptidase [Stutzerimonas decontaminans]|uniref:Cro/Cl family transcriptional regulator n=1 Tax=Stutzerimonas stutzeri TaxID=316 RepID=A0A023WV23_STUST|nr:Cro/Cl family transcriptional regulator [Stutzerimonas decontaminans]